MNSVTRTAGYLIRRGTDVTEAERDAYQARKTAVLAKLRASGGDP
jgi:hypothetical protein